MEGFKGFKGSMVTTLAVLTEALYLLNHSVKAQQACLQWIHCGAVKLFAFDASLLERAETLMVKYKDVPMDFADATMVVLAEKIDVGRIYTLDKSGFTVFRYNRSKSFEILPE